MTEEELIEEGFERQDVLAKDSGNRDDYYYYTYSFGGGKGLISIDNEEATKNKWAVYLDEYETKIIDMEEVVALISILRKKART